MKGKSKKGLIVGIIALIAVLAAAAVVAVVIATRQNGKPNDTANGTRDNGQGSTAAGTVNDTEPAVELQALPKPENPSEADEYFWENATVYRVINAKDSEDVKTEKNALSYFTDRGFNQNDVEFEYDIDGTYGDTKTASDGSEDKHPMYRTVYRAENGDVWVLYLVNGNIIANPLSFNNQTNLPGALYLTETGMLTSYDNGSNKFYEIVPLESVATVKKVQTINAELLNSLTVEELKKYE